MVVGTLRERVVLNVAGGRRPLVSRASFQLLGGFIVCALIPVAVRGPVETAVSVPSSLNTAGFGSALAVLLGYYLILRIGYFPGVQLGAKIIFAISTSFGIVALGLFLLHLSYSRFVFTTGYALALVWFAAVHIATQRLLRPQLAVVPGGNAQQLASLPGPQWLVLARPPESIEGISAVVADLRHSFSEEWERFLADCTLRGLPVFHTKQVKESLTGKVEIEHLSENNFGSLLPSLAYLKVKQVIDWTAAFAFLPVFALVFAVVAPLIVLESGSPVFYRQERVGYRGRRFRVYKFRTMRSMGSEAVGTSERDTAITQEGDKRITRVGRILRKYRIDELPQVLNILTGEMSWIGPRPEASALAEWYEADLPFYRYRHVVRPGITGWAQVSQGHVALPQQVLEKLHYDFFYIKYLSPWLDLLVAIRTVRTILRGLGAK